MICPIGADDLECYSSEDAVFTSRPLSVALVLRGSSSTSLLVRLLR
jgi:hypothetical protein